MQEWKKKIKQKKPHYSLNEETFTKETNENKEFKPGWLIKSKYVYFTKPCQNFSKITSLLLLNSEGFLVHVKDDCSMWKTIYSDFVSRNRGYRPKQTRITRKVD